MNKICPYCAEEVKPTAKVCPHCQQWLSVWSLRNPIVAIISVFLVILIFLVGFLKFIHKAVNPGVDFSPYRNSLSVVESRMDFQPDEHGPLIYVVAVITNQCELAWKRPQLDVRFYNQAGTMIDAVTYTGSGIIYPKGELAVRIKTPPNHAQTDYASCKVYVRSATDPKVRFWD